ncbi:MAG: FtsQ-type POTRA domain-containing protein [Eubacteriales bacterium]|nr:FtsQ-type POTRA domain-containing protein [Eubacteriales bacterium]MDD3073421.1 FtsQ-type POTRA domain-containing protein [Eubacteriales bacterium]MDD4078508.1 FtsQ-type POTRA domain-containing protein [Eubacteriales bacterium]MDD4768983.1 FtsQ-type POTRA domain-containing protein [Eubacteriales bacterium]
MLQDNVLAYRGRAKKNKVSKVFVVLLISFTALVLFAYYLASPLALVDKVEVTGNCYLQPADIQQLVGLEPGMHMWRLHLGASRDKLSANPWVLEARIRRQFPNSILISLEERIGVAVVMSANGNWIVAEDKVVLAENEGFSLPWVTGLELGALTPGTIAEGQTVDLALAWANAFQPIASQISEICFDSYPVVITVFTTDGYKVLFDSFTAPGDKIQDFAVLLEELRRSGQKGIIDFRGLQGRGIFIPWPENSAEE